jgi:hypothetical protein
MNPARLLLTVLASLALVACGGGAPAGTSGNAESAGAPMPAQAPAAPPVDAPAMDTGGAQAERPASPDQSQIGQLPSQRLVIRTAALALQVEQVREAESAVRATADRLGGYVVSAQTSGDDEFLSARVVFRVPSDRFDEALEGVAGIASKVLSRSVSGQDVTEEFVDLESRLRTLEATRDRLLDLLARAETVEEALSVNTALTDVQGQVEQVKGRMQFLQQSAAMSTVDVELRPVPITPIIEEDAWQPLQVARGALRELLEFGQGLVNVAIVLLVWSPVWLPLLLLGRWGLRRLIRASKRPIVPPAPPSPESPA